MSSYILTISPKGQITIPSKERQKFKHQKCLLETQDNTLIIKPIKIKIIETQNRDELKDFGQLADSSFEFWSDPEEDIFDEFYSNNKNNS